MVWWRGRLGVWIRDLKRFEPFPSDKVYQEVFGNVYLSEIEVGVISSRQHVLGSQNTLTTSPSPTRRPFLYPFPM